MGIDPIERLKYPLGKAEIPENISESDVKKWIGILDAFPQKMRYITENLSGEQLDTPYRPNGWTIRQVVHHVVDSHSHSYIRFKWALTEEKPLIKAYREELWAELHDYDAPIELSLKALESLHAKLVYLLNGLSQKDLKRTFLHPENQKEVALDKNIGIYAWHSQHHFAHIENLLKRKGWK
jgi:hypothetical protein